MRAGSGREKALSESKLKLDSLAGKRNIRNPRQVDLSLLGHAL